MRLTCYWSWLPLQHWQDGRIETRRHFFYDKKIVKFPALAHWRIAETINSCVCLPLLPMKTSQWARENFCSDSRKLSGWKLIAPLFGQFLVDLCECKRAFETYGKQKKKEMLLVTDPLKLRSKMLKLCGLGYHISRIYLIMSQFCFLLSAWSQVMQ